MIDPKAIAANVRELSEYVAQQPPVHYEQAAAQAMCDAADAIEALEARAPALAAEKERDDWKFMQQTAEGQLNRQIAHTVRAEARLREAEGLLRGHSCGYKIGNPMTPEPCEICKFLDGRTTCGTCGKVGGGGLEEVYGGNGTVLELPCPECGGDR